MSRGIHSTLWLLCAALISPIAAAEGPLPVSPGAATPGTAVEARCPTFHWAGVAGARGYELAVFRVADDGSEPVLVTRASVSGDARGFTLPSSDCLERGQRYAWSVAAAGERLAWSQPFLFELEAGPSLDEVEQAMAVLERHRGRLLRDEAAPAIARDAARGATANEPVLALRPRSVPRIEGALPGTLTAPSSGIARIASGASTPTLGTPSLKVSANVSLSAASNLFKNGNVFLWDDTDGNTALGRNALASTIATGSNNTAVGRDALRYTTGGALTQGSANTAVGDRALRTNTTGYNNTASGYQALFYNTTGAYNAASGSGALRANVTGDYNTAHGHGALFSTTSSRNTAVGTFAGFNATTGFDNIFIGSGALGTMTDTHVIRIGGTATGGATPGAGQQNRTFINGIRGITTLTNDAVNVLIDSFGQLGTASSSRATKQDIEDLGALADRLLALRPVAFRYRQHAEADPETPLQFGLIAEEVAEVFPELVVYDEEGRPETVKYHLLSALLLGEVQRLHARLEAVEARGSTQTTTAATSSKKPSS